jgi:hypothetical protein
VPQRNDTSKIRHTKPFQHCNITHWTHIDDIWNGSAVTCLVCWPQTILFLAWLWIKSAKLSTSTVPGQHGMSKIRHTKPFLHSNITHWTHIDDISNGSTVSCLVFWPQTTVILGWLWVKSAKLMASGSARATWHVKNQIHKTFSAF